MSKFVCTSVWIPHPVQKLALFTFLAQSVSFIGGASGLEKLQNQLPSSGEILNENFGLTYHMESIQFTPTYSLRQAFQVDLLFMVWFDGTLTNQKYP